MKKFENQEYKAVKEMEVIQNKMEMYWKLTTEILERHNGFPETMTSEELRIVKEAIICHKTGLEKMLDDIMPVCEQWKDLDCGESFSIPDNQIRRMKLN